MPPEPDVEQPDPLIHQPVRLKIMAALKALPQGTSEASQLEFVRLKAIVGATEGNLGAHITALETAGYIDVAKDFVGKKPRTRVKLNRVGRKAFSAYTEFLKSLLDGD
jgi:DNA-binding transcriptional ArsR family regulator